MSFFAVADFEGLSIADDPTADGRLAAHARVEDKRIVKQAKDIINTLTDETLDLLIKERYVNSLFTNNEGEFDGRLSVVFKKNAENGRVTVWLDGQHVDEPINSVSEVLEEIGPKLYEVMEFIFEHQNLDSILDRGRDGGQEGGHYLGPLTILVCKGPKGCSQQEFHWDFTDPMAEEKIFKPLSLIFNPMVEEASLITAGPEGGEEEITHKFKENEYVAFRGDLCHAGAAYKGKTHIRFHAYILHPKSPEAYDEGNVVKAGPESESESEPEPEPKPDEAKKKRKGFPSDSDSDSESESDCDSDSNSDSDSDKYFENTNPGLKKTSNSQNVVAYESPGTEESPNNAASHAGGSGYSTDDPIVID